MKKETIKKIIIAMLVITTICVSVLAILFGASKTYSAYTKVIVPETGEVSVYIGGNDVEKTDEGYFALPGTKITVTVVNESKLFAAMTISGQSYDSPIAYTSPIAELTVPDSGEITVEVSTSEPYAEDNGKYFGNPYVLNKEADVLAVSRILAGTSTEADYEQIGAVNKTEDDIRYGYFRLGTNLFISSDEFFGLGFRGNLPFGGCFDFDGYTATINLVRTSHKDDEFSFNGTTHTADYGFFAYVYGDGEKPCLIRNAKVQGFIGLNTMNNVDSIDHTDHVNAGGVAGTLGKNVVLDGIESAVSVSAQTRFADLYLGGIFGICSSSVESWCDVIYDGVFNDVSGVTYGDKAGAITGAFAGIVQNASINGVTIDGERSMVLANALGDISGLAIAGGFAGVVELGDSFVENLSDPRPMLIKNINIYAETDFSVSAVINNSESAKKNKIDPDNFKADSAAAVTGGIIGIVNRGRIGGTALSEDDRIVFSDIRFLRSGMRDEDTDLVGSTNSGRLMIKASTQDGDSSGAVFAGGAVGYIYGVGNDYIVKKIPDNDDVQYFFNCSVDISAVQNGVGPAYAGGVFGYNGFRIDYGENKTLKVGVVPSDYDFTVSAEQSATSSSYGNVFYNVCAGGYSSRFNVGFDSTNVEFYLGNGRITALRDVGSTAIGDVNAGGIVGRALGYGSASSTINQYDSNSSQSGTIGNTTVYYSANSRIEASCYSYDSINSTSNYGNNVCAGGAIGYVLAYKSISNLSVIFDGTLANAGKSAEYFVCGTQNGANKSDNDLKTEGFVGGAFGLVIDTKLSNIKLYGDEAENSVVYFTSTNSPNTASVGGLIGAIWRRKVTSGGTSSASGAVMLDGSEVKNIHVAGKAYCEKNNTSDTYDIYVGGTVGVFANPNGGNTTITDMLTDNCVVDAIGEKTMLTYAGGTVAGAWWSSTTNISYAVVKDSAITASSIAPFAYAGGIVGLTQHTKVSYCLTKDTDVKAVSEQSSAYAGGIVARAKDSDTITYSYSNASLKAQGNSDSTSIKYGIIAKTDIINNTGDSTSNASKNFFVYETAGTSAAYPSESGGVRALCLSSNYRNEASVDVGNSTRVYSVISSAQSTTMSIKSYDKSIAETDGLNVKGVSAGITYVGAYCVLGGNEYLLCSYPVTVADASDPGSGLTLATDDGKLASAQKCDEYIDYTYGSGTKSIQYIYFRRNVGNPDTVKKVNAVAINAEYLPKTVRFYDITTVEKAVYFDENTTTAQKQARIAAIIAAKGDSCDVSAFNGRANVGYNYVDGAGDGAAKKSVYFYANDNVRENTIILMECDYGSLTYGVIIEFVPNRLKGISISPENGTPPLDVRVEKQTDQTTGEEKEITHYVYTAGDVVRFGATLSYTYPAPRSYVVETIYGGTGVTENGIVAVSAGGVYTVTCRDLKNTVSTTVVVEAKTEVSYAFSYSGADGSSDRKMVESCNFLFNVTPQPGYGLDPVIKVTVGNTVFDGTFTSDGLVIVAGEESFVLACAENKASEYSYDLTVGTDFIDYIVANGNSVAFSITYRKIYSLVFISNYNGNDFFSTTVAAGEKFADVNPSGMEEWTNSLIAARYGYDFRGYYTLSKAGDVSAYGKSFEDMRKDGVSSVSGTMRFYARWTYNVTVESPENVSVTSSFSSSMLHDGKMIPLDSANGFGFVIETGDGWIGKPRYRAFIRKKDGTCAEITSLFVSASQENGYYISSDKIEEYDSGYLFVKIYADELEFAVGDDPRYDGNALYTDGIFTLTYTVNYGSGDSVYDFSFDFAPLSLPKGTSMRLFYRKDGTTVWGGSCVLSAGAEKVTVSDFKSLKDNSKLELTSRSGAKSERFILVVTLPDNSNEFGLSLAAENTVTVTAFDYSATTDSYGVFSATVTDKAVIGTDANEVTFVLHPAVIRSVTVNGSTFDFTESGKLSDGVTDHRHNGVRYMWRIEKAGGGSVATATFGGLGNEVVRTTSGIYYYAYTGEVTITGELSGYTVSLIAVKNIRQPAESPVIFRYNFA